MGKNGRPVPTTGAQKKLPCKYHDFIHFLPKSKDNIYSVCFPLYQQGISLREIERQTGFARTSIQNVLTSTGLPGRKNKIANKIPLKRQCPMKGGPVPYGYAYLEGRLVPDPKEYKIVLNIHRYWQVGESYRGIAGKLNDKGITTRTGKKWTNEIIKRIIDRQECDLKSHKNLKGKTK